MKKCQLRFEETKQKQHVIAVWEKFVGFAFVIKQFYDENKATKRSNAKKRVNAERKLFILSARSNSYTLEWD